MTQTFTREGRSKYIGGSDIHHITNQPPWGCKRRLWYEKKLYPYDEEPVVTAAMRRGTALEPIIRKEFAKKFNYRIGKDLPIIDDAPEWVGGNVDGIILPGKGNKNGPGKGNERGPGIAEFKAPGSWAYNAMMGEGLSNGYIYQGQYYMWSRGVEWCHWGIMPIEAWELDCPKLERSEIIIDIMREDCEEFWELLKGDKPPEPPLDTLAGHCNNCPFTTTCKGEEGAAEIEIVKRSMAAAGPGYFVIKDEDLSRLVDQRQSFAVIEKDAKGEVGGMKGQILDMMRDLNVEGAILKNWKVKRSHIIRSMFQEKAFQKQHPELYDEFCSDAEWDEIRVRKLTDPDKELFLKGERP